jgi:hypothetical protein
VRTLLLIAGLAFAGAIAATVVFAMGTDGAGSLAFVLGGVAVAAGYPGALDAVGRWGVPGDGH